MRTIKNRNVRRMEITSHVQRVDMKPFLIPGIRWTPVCQLHHPSVVRICAKIGAYHEIDVTFRSVYREIFLNGNLHLIMALRLLKMA